MASTDNADVDVIHRAMDELHLQLVARLDGPHVHWCWDGHHGTSANGAWATRDDAIAHMRVMLDEYRRDARS